MICVQPKIDFVLSRADLETLVSRMAEDPNITAPSRVGYKHIGEVKRLPDGMFKIPTDMGANPFDEQGLIYSPTPPSDRDPIHLVGYWYEY